eukprot:628444-Amphidinium_carterae.1
MQPRFQEVKPVRVHIRSNMVSTVMKFECFVLADHPKAATRIQSKTSAGFPNTSHPIHRS